MIRTIVTAALPYAYAIPHLGNFVGSVLPADVYFKYLKMKKEDAIFICGSDMHGTPIELRAIKEKMEPEKLADEMHLQIKGLFEDFECTFTYYGDTNSPQNKEVVYQIFESLNKKGYIKDVENLQAYCNVDKRFLTDRLIEGECPYCHYSKARGDQCENCGRLLNPDQIINPTCAICGKSDIVFKKVKNLAFELNKLQKELENFTENKSETWSKNARNKSISYVKEGLKQREITRNMKWGFPVPMEGFDNSVFYVWFDAPIGYIGITKEWDENKWNKYWKSDTNLIHFMGKDNIEFHGVFWPAILIGSDLGYPLPKTIRASEYLTSKEIKFSKSMGVGLNMKDAIGILESDYWRFALMHLYPETADSEFTIEILEEVVNKIMNDKIGNLIHRVLTIAKANKDLLGLIKLDPNDKLAVDAVNNLVDAYRRNLDIMQLREALNHLATLADYGNMMMSRDEPWKLAKSTNNSDRIRFSYLIGSLITIAYDISILLWPFVPNASRKALSYFGIDRDPLLNDLDSQVQVKFDIDFLPIFSKLDKEQIDQLNKYR